MIYLFIYGRYDRSPAFAQDTDRRSLIERAKKEGEVIWYTTAGLQDSKPMADEFQKDYPFIKLSVVRAGSGVLVNKILNEARAQKVFFDIFNTNDESILPLKRRGLIGRYVSPEATFYDDDLKDKRRLLALRLRDSMVSRIQYAHLVKKNDVPKSYLELLNPKWKGKKIAVGSDNGALILSGLMRVWGREKAVGYFQTARRPGSGHPGGQSIEQHSVACGGRIPDDSRCRQYPANLRLSRRAH